MTARLMNHRTEQRPGTARSPQLRSAAMRFRQIDLPVHDPSGWSAWMTRKLDEPPHPVMPDAITVGWSTLCFRYLPEADVTVRTGRASSWNSETAKLIKTLRT